MQRYGSRIIEHHLRHQQTRESQWKFSVMTAVQFAAGDDDDSEDNVIDVDYYANQPALLLIVKWGGELTTAGVMQAEALGMRKFEQMGALIVRTLRQTFPHSLPRHTRWITRRGQARLGLPTLTFHLSS